MDKFFYFKVTFLAVTAGLFSGLVVYGLLESGFSDSAKVTSLLLKSLAIAVSVGLLLGLLNMYFKIGNFSRKTK